MKLFIKGLQHSPYSVFLLIVLSFLTFMVFFQLSTVAFKPDGLIITGPWTLEDSSGKQTVTLPFYHRLKQPEVVSLSTSFFMPDEHSVDTLVLVRPYCHGIQIYLNNTMISHVGDFDRRSANIWNSVLTVPLPETLLLEENHLELVFASWYDVGLGASPYLQEYTQVVKRESLTRFLDQEFYLIVIGASLIIGVMLLLASLWVPDMKKVFLYVGLSSLVGAVFLLDFQFRTDTGSAQFFFIFKKTILSCGYLATLFLLLGTETLLSGKPKLSRFMVWGTIFAITALWFTGDFITLKGATDFANIIILINPLLTVYLVIKSRFLPLVFSTTFMGWTITLAIISPLLSLDLPYMLGYGIMVCVINFSIFLVNNYKTTYQRLIYTHNNSLLDPLTQAYNRGILNELPFRPGSALVMLDLDAFKKLNDTYGHDFGDQVLKKLVVILKESIRQSDIVVRYGGDEFLIILQNCPPEKAASIMHHTLDKFKAAFPNHPVSFSFGISKHDQDWYQALIEADRSMYIMKI